MRMRAYCTYTTAYNGNWLALGLRGRTTPRMPTHPVFDSSAVHGIRWPNDFDCEAEQRQWSGEQVWRDARDEPSTPKDARSALRM